jgi:hypothetical protein
MSTGVMVSLGFFRFWVGFGISIGIGDLLPHLWQGR